MWSTRRAASTTRRRTTGRRPQRSGDCGVDMLAAMTMTNSAEAVGIARSAREVGLPVAISFTVETPGRRPSGESLRDAMAKVDADTPPAYFGVNCAHPSHFEACFAGGGDWTSRIRGLRANASARSHAELDAATELDIGDPARSGRSLPTAAHPAPCTERAGRVLRHRSTASTRNPRCMGLGGLTNSQLGAASPAVRRCRALPARKRRI